MNMHNQKNVQILFKDLKVSKRVPKLVDKKSATSASTNPSTSHIIDANVISEWTSEKQKQPKIDQEIQYLANALSRFVALYGKSEKTCRNKYKHLKLSSYKLLLKLSRPLLNYKRVLLK